MIRHVHTSIIYFKTTILTVIYLMHIKLINIVLIFLHFSYPTEYCIMYKYILFKYNEHLPAFQFSKSTNRNWNLYKV